MFKLWNKHHVPDFFPPYVHHFCTLIFNKFSGRKNLKNHIQISKKTRVHTVKIIYIGWYQVKFRVCAPIQFIKKKNIWILWFGIDYVYILSISCIYTFCLYVYINSLYVYIHDFSNFIYTVYMMYIYMFFQISYTLYI